MKSDLRHFSRLGPIAIFQKLLSTSSNLLTVASRRNSIRLIPYWESCSRSKSILMLMWAAVYSRNMSRFLQVAKSVYIAFLEHHERCQMRKIHLAFCKIIWSKIFIYFLTEKLLLISFAEASERSVPSLSLRICST